MVLIGIDIPASACWLAHTETQTKWKGAPDNKIRRPRTQIIPTSLLSPRTSAPDILPQPVTGHLIPLNLLPRHGQLSPQSLKSSLAQACETPVQLLLVLLLAQRDLPCDARAGSRGHRCRHRLVGDQSDVAVLVVVYVDLDGALEAVGRGVENVEGAPASIPILFGISQLDHGPLLNRVPPLPEIVGAVFVGDDDDGDLGIVFYRVYAIRGIRKVLFHVGSEALES